MPTSVKERLKTELEQAQSEGRQRAGRISDILKAAASMTFEELKEGSAELNVVTRKSVAEIVTELQDTPAAGGTEVAADPTLAVDVEPVSEEDTSEDADVAPTWKSILRSALAVVRDRRGDWLQAFKERFQANAVKADQEAVDKYGDRYLKVKNFFQRAVEQLKSRQPAPPKADSEAASQLVSIEVMEADAVVDATPTAQQLASEDQA